MDYKYIEQLLDRYWECETSLEEEKILRAFFSQKDVPARLLPFKDLFTYEQEELTTDTLGADFDERLCAIIEEPQPVKARIITMPRRLMPLFKAAAVVAIFLTLGNASQRAFTDDVQPADVAGMPAAHEGVSVALGDSARIDSLQHGGMTGTAIK